MMRSRTALESAHGRFYRELCREVEKAVTSGDALRQSGDELDSVLATVLIQLWEASREPSGKRWPLAKLSKRTSIPMSTLRRVLTQLSLAEVVDVDVQDDGRGFASLNAAGLEACAALFDEYATVEPDDYRSVAS